jgi:hypothetical protein
MGVGLLHVVDIPGSEEEERSAEEGDGGDVDDVETKLELVPEPRGLLITNGHHESEDHAQKDTQDPVETHFPSIRIGIPKSPNRTGLREKFRYSGMTPICMKFFFDTP